MFKLYILQYCIYIRTLPHIVYFIKLNGSTSEFKSVAAVRVRLICFHLTTVETENNIKVI